MMMFYQALYLLKCVLPILLRKAWMLGNIQFISRVEQDCYNPSDDRD